MKKHLHAIVLLVMGLLMLPTVSYAHLVELLSSFPENGTILSQSPGVITAVFNEEIQSATSNLQVFDADGNQIDNGDGGIDLNDPNHASMRVNLPTLAPGAYTVRWQVVLLDGDATTGAFNFFVGDEAAANTANFTPIPEGSEVATAVASTAPNNTIWLIAGIGVTALFIGGAFFIFSRRSRTAS
ncbi:MAG: copper resistance protein CopC [Anaerolineaceae bacterium]|nr:copper resistance protein CopC [Anaerolineaceae bacterium]